MEHIRKIIQKISVARIGLIVSPLAVVMLFLVSVKIYFIRAYPEQFLKEQVMAFIKENFGKASTFDDVYMSAFGNIIISNLNVSISGDFNDNINLIKCPSAEIRLNFFKLFSGVIIIKEIVFEDADITVYKKYGKGYYETFDEIFRLNRPLRDISNIDHDRFVVDISSSRMEYREVFRSEMLTVKLDRFSLNLLIRGDVIDYRISGRAIPHPNSDLSRARISFSGSVRQGKDNVCIASKNSISIHGLDMRYLQPYLNEALKDPLSVRGRFDAGIRFSSSGPNISAECRLEMINLTAEKMLKGAKHAYISNENLNMDFIIDITGGGSRFILRHASLYDDVFRLSIDGVYSKNEKEHFVETVFNTNDINLERLSERITPWKDTAVKGSLKIEGRIRLDFASGSARGTEFQAKLKEFGITFHESKHSREFLRDLDAGISLKNDGFNASLKCTLERSQIVGSWDTKVKSWTPFSSETAISISAPSLEFSHIAYPLIAAVDLIYTGAYSDRKFGYENIIFREEPAGKLLNQNNLQFRFEAQKILAGHRAELHDLILAASLREGVFSVDAFSLSGYAAQYSLKSTAQFNLWMPMVSLDASMKGFDLRSFAADAGVKGEIGGIVNAGISFQVGAFRLSQLLENAIVDANVEFSNGVLKDTTFQDAIVQFLKKSGIKNAPITELSGINASFVFNQRGENFLVSKLVLESDKVRFYTRGKYDYFEGLTIPLEAKVSTTEGQADTQTLYYEIKGSLLRPILVKTKRPKEKEGDAFEPLVLFDVQ